MQQAAVDFSTGGRVRDSLTHKVVLSSPVFFFSPLWFAFVVDGKPPRALLALVGGNPPVLYNWGCALNTQYEDRGGVGSWKQKKRREKEGATETEIIQEKIVKAFFSFSRSMMTVLLSCRPSMVQLL